MPTPKLPDYKLQADLLITRLVEELKFPSDEYRLDHLLPTKPIDRRIRTAFFESEKWCNDENVLRGAELERAAANIPVTILPIMSDYNLDPFFASRFQSVARDQILDLAARLRCGGTATPLPSTHFKRQLRFLFFGAVVVLF